VRARRIENEWKVLQELALRNPACIQGLHWEETSAGEFIRVELHHTDSPVKTKSGIRILSSHHIEFSFPRFFPSLPIEAALKTPVFHPNVDPDNGFVCLWTRTCPGDTMVDAITRAQRIIAWDLANFAPDHLMQPDAIHWYRDGQRTVALPCAFLPIDACGLLDGPRLLTGFGRQRQRLFP
jgi:ubiquitin-protein ligase